jgi:hypothetical protein
MENCDPLCDAVIKAAQRLDDGEKILALIPTMNENLKTIMQDHKKLTSFIELQDNLEGFANTIKGFQRWILILAPILGLFGAIAWFMKKLGLI